MAPSIEPFEQYPSNPVDKRIQHIRIISNTVVTQKSDNQYSIIIRTTFLSMTDTVVYILRHDETVMMRMKQEAADEENQENEQETKLDRMIRKSQWIFQEIMRDELENFWMRRGRFSD